ncbi:hypothetical protein B0H15DRAFT_195374 [Mycena belliarum]|uniref:Uncharacterized protein n=1 Tax=Mycena belliarum TaxID=1033014 RepID=A0AAD6UH30_9AGAR|nr:hypothetical protein B0H15DRAFT_195374 [Mycena belliae]
MRRMNEGLTDRPLVYTELEACGQERLLIFKVRLHMRRRYQVDSEQEGKTTIELAWFERLVNTQRLGKAGVSVESASELFIIILARGPSPERAKCGQSKHKTVFGFDILIYHLPDTRFACLALAALFFVEPHSIVVNRVTVVWRRVIEDSQRSLQLEPEPGGVREPETRGGFLDENGKRLRHLPWAARRHSTEIQKRAPDSKGRADSASICVRGNIK